MRHPAFFDFASLASDARRLSAHNPNPKDFLMRRALLGVLLALLAVPLSTACATFEVITPQVVGGPDYIILKTLGSREKIYDCYSKPGEVWDPTCVLVKYRGSLHAGEDLERKAIRKEDRVNTYRNKRRGDDD